MVALSTLLTCAALAASPDATLLEFYSPNCGPCQSMQPTIQRLLKDGYPIQQINVEAAPEVARRFQIRHVPTTVLVVDGKEIGRLDGVRSRDDIEQLFQQAAKLQKAAEPVKEAAEELVVRGQSPEPRRGLGLFNKLSGKKPSEAGVPPTVIPGNTNVAAQEEPGFGRDDAFAGRAPAPFSPEPAATSRRGDDAAPVSAAPVRHQPSGEEDIRNFSLITSGDSDRIPKQTAMLATVRLKVQDPGGSSFGTGTIIDVMKDEALVVTCGHIFRDSKGQGKIAVDLHESLTDKPIEGQLISFDLKRDIALVSIRPGVEVKAVRVESDLARVAPGAPAFSIGCDHGREPSVIESRITAVDKYSGSPNYTASGMPVEGRSGGGLYLADGTLIGICNAADPQDKEGLYAALGTIHWQLDQIGQSAIYQQSAKTPPGAIAAAPPRNELPAAAVPAPFVSQPTAGEKEIIFFVRDRNQPGRGEAIVIDRPTPELMDILSRAARSRAAGDLSASSPQPTALRSLPEEAPVVRGQNR